MSVEDAEHALPATRSHWKYETGEPEYEGFEGFITTTAEIDRLSQPLQGSRSGSSDSAIPEDDLLRRVPMSQ
jgi:hypothetical protein